MWSLETAHLVIWLLALRASRPTSVVTFVALPGALSLGIQMPHRISTPTACCDTPSIPDFLPLLDHRDDLPKKNIRAILLLTL